MARHDHRDRGRYARNPLDSEDPVTRCAALQQQSNRMADQVNYDLAVDAHVRGMAKMASGEHPALGWFDDPRLRQGPPSPAPNVVHNLKNAASDVHFMTSWDRGRER